MIKALKRDGLLRTEMDEQLLSDRIREERERYGQFTAVLRFILKDAVARLSRRVHHTARSAEFWYDVEGWDLPVAYESLLAQYFDLMVRQDYEQWTLGMAWPYDAALHQALKAFECDDGEGCGVRVEPIDPKYPRWGQRKIARPTRLLAEITAYLDYAEAESLKGLRALPWERAPEDDVEVDDTEEWDGEYAEEDSMDEVLVQLTNCIREDILKGDLRAFYLAWKKLGDRGSQQAPPEIPSKVKKLPGYMNGVSRMLKSSAER